jgi:hypothetical protein
VKLFELFQPLHEANFVNPDSIDHWVRELIGRQPAFPKDPALTAWLAKRLRQHFTSMPDAEAGKIMQKMPGDEYLSLELLVSTYGDWVRQALDRGETLFWFDTNPRLDEPVRHVIDYVISLDKVAKQPQEHEASLQEEAARRLRKLTRLTFTQVSEHADDWFARLQAAGREHAERADASGSKPVMNFHDGFRWVEITDPAALDREGDIMQHCVGGGSYDKDLTDGRVRIFSLRDAKNQPHVTVEVSSLTRVIEDPDDDWNTQAAEGQWQVIQIKGKQNEGPAPKYARYIGPLLNGLKYPLGEDAVWDLHNTGLFSRLGLTGNQWGTLSQVGSLIGESGTYRIVAAWLGDTSSVCVARGDVPVMQFFLRNQTAFSRISGCNDEADLSPPVLRDVVQVLLDKGFSFQDQADYYLRFSEIAIQGEQATLVSDLPALAERDGYRAAAITQEEQDRILLWVTGEGLAAHYVLWKSDKVRQVDHAHLIEVATLPLARVVADAFNVLEVNGLMNRTTEHDVAKLVHCPAKGYPWQPVPALLAQGNAR